LVQAGCWKAAWMTLIWFVDGVVLTEPHQLALLADGLLLFSLREPVPSTCVA
jgi:hypothetical protein